MEDDCRRVAPRVDEERAVNEIDKIRAFARRAADASINGKVIRIEICTCGMAIRARLGEKHQVRLISWDRFDADTDADAMADYEIGALVRLLDIRAGMERA